MTQSQVVDQSLINKSVVSKEVEAAKKSYIWFGNFLLPMPLIAMPPEPDAYGLRSRDDQLLSTVQYEDKWANAVAIAATKCASLAFDVDGDVPLRVNRSHDLLTMVDGMQGWSQFIAKHMQDFLCTDNGGHIQIVRQSKSIASRILGLLHLDTRRCYRTGDPAIPVIYRDRLGYLHELKAHEVISIADMPSSRVTFNGIGFCAASRAYKTIYRMAAIETYITEKVSGRRPLAVNLLTGINQPQLEQLFRAAQGDADAKGMTSYMGAMISAVPSDGEISNVTIPLAELPDAFNLEQERANARLEYANTIGLDIQDLQPGQIGGSLGSSTQSQVLDDKAKGKGLSYWRKAFTEQLNLKVLPDQTTFMFVEKDYRDEASAAAAANARQDLRTKMITAGMIRPDQALQMAVDGGDAPKEFISTDVTPNLALGSDEKPDEGDAADTGAGDASGDAPVDETADEMTAKELTSEIRAARLTVEQAMKELKDERTE